MGVIIGFGTLTVEDPTDPASRPLVAWPNLVEPERDGTRLQHSIPGKPTRSLSFGAWNQWRRWPSVGAILKYCQVPAEVDKGLISRPIDDDLIRLIDTLHARARRWAWLPKVGGIGFDRAQWLRYWAQRAREEFGDQAYIGFS